jgi:hypothetical protein
MTEQSKPFNALYAAALKRYQQGTNLNKPVTGNKKYFESGRTYNTTIIGLDYTAFATNHTVDLVLQSETGETHSEMLWVLDQKRTNVSLKLVGLISAVFKDPEILSEFLCGLAGSEDQVIHMFNRLRGCKVGVSVGRGAGFIIERQPTGVYVVRDVTTNEQLMDTEFQQAREARTAAKTAGYRESWPRIDKYIAIAGDTNDANFAAIATAEQRALSDERRASAQVPVAAETAAPVDAVRLVKTGSDTAY